MIDRRMGSETRASELMRTYAELKKGGELTAECFSEVIDRFNAVGCFDGALTAFWDLKQSEMLPNEEALTGAVRACAALGYEKQALDLVRELIDVGIHHDSEAYPNALRACRNSWEHAIGILDEMLEASVAMSDAMYESSMLVFAQGGRWQQSLLMLEGLVLQDVQPDDAVWTSAIESCGRASRWQHALMLLDTRRPVFGADPSAATVRAALEASAQGGNVELWRSLSAGLPAKTEWWQKLSAGMLLEACSQARRWEAALEALEAVRQKRLDLSMGAYASVIGAFQSSGLLEQTARVVSEMRALRITPDARIYGAQMKACVGTDRNDEAFDIFAEMQEAKPRLQPGSLGMTQAHNVLIQAHAHGQKWERALGVLAMMPRRRVETDAGTWSGILSCGNAPPSLPYWLLEKATGARIQPNQRLYEAATKSVCTHAVHVSWEKATHVLEASLGARDRRSFDDNAWLMRTWTKAGLRERSLAFLEEFRPNGKKDLKRRKRDWKQQEVVFTRASVRGILTQGADVVALDKPAGVAVVELLEKLQDAIEAAGHSDKDWGAPEVDAGSELDAACSGVLLVMLGAPRGETTPWHDFLRLQFAGALVHQEFVCLICGSLGEAGACGELDVPAAPAARGPGPAPEELPRTRYSVEETFVEGKNTYSLVLVQPPSGSTEQLRAHFAGLGKPLVGDEVYSSARQREAYAGWAPRLFLHLERARLIDAAGETLEAEAHRPGDLNRALSRLRRRCGGGR